jgi:hypothetical protein
LRSEMKREVAMESNRRMERDGKKGSQIEGDGD